MAERVEIPEGVTEAPWTAARETAAREGYFTVSAEIEGETVVIARVPYAGHSYWLNWADARLIALAPTIAAELTALREREAVLREALEALRPALDALPPGPWKTWTSCSFRRISHKGDGDVLHAYNQRGDGHPDLSWTEAECNAICAVVNGLRALTSEGQ